MATMSQYMLSSAATFGFFMSIGSVSHGSYGSTLGLLTEVGDQDGFALPTTGRSDEALAVSIAHCNGMAQSGRDGSQAWKDLSQAL